MKNQKKNPINAVVQPLQGQPLPQDWRQKAMNNGGNYDQRNWEEIFNNPRWSSKFNGSNVENITRDGRLPQPSWNDLFGTK
jgi:hypothetical protein